MGHFVALRMEFWAASGILLASIILGGGTRQGFLSDMILQLICLPILIAFLMMAWLRSGLPHIRNALIVMGAIVLVPLVQLIEMPPLLWSALPGREQFARIMDFVGQGDTWMPISLDPSATLGSVLSLIPPFALFLTVLFLDRRERRRIVLLLFAIGGLAAALGFMQMRGGPESPLRFFDRTNVYSAVGFFANRNHFADFLSCLIPFIAAWVIASIASRQQNASNKIRSMTVVVSGAVAVILLIVIHSIIRSRAGIVLTAGAISFSVLLAFSYRRLIVSSRRSLTAMVAVGVVVLFLGAAGLSKVFYSYNPEEVDAGRMVITENTLDAAWDYAPFGSGMGSFVPIYQMYEKVEQAGAPFINRAHNDLAELLLEAGVLGGVTLLLLITWIASNCVRCWRRSIPDQNHIDHLLPLAASGVVVLPLLHSLVDYPLRTAAMTAVFALSLGLIVPCMRNARHSVRAESSLFDEAT